MMINLPTSSEPSLRLMILMPLRDDWKSASVLIGQIDPILRSHSCVADVLLIDDDSRQFWESADFQGKYEAIQSIRTLRLRLNLGHQRAIAIGLVHVFLTAHCDAVLVMDADGEDTAEGVSELLDAFRKDHRSVLIFAQRSRRSESLRFRCLYEAYLILNRLLTGLTMRVGNFSILPPAYLDALVVESELWNHYAASVFRSRRPFRMIPIPRGRRTAGTPRMDFVSLVTHGLSAISVFGDRVATRLLFVSLAGAFLAAAGIIGLVTIRLFTHLAIPGWVMYAAGTMVMLLVQLISMAAIFALLMLSNRTNLGFVPLRDYSLFIAEQVQIYAV